MTGRTGCRQPYSPSSGGLAVCRSVSCLGRLAQVRRPEPWQDAGVGTSLALVPKSDDDSDAPALLAEGKEMSRTSPDGDSHYEVSIRRYARTSTLLRNSAKTGSFARLVDLTTERKVLMASSTTCRRRRLPLFAASRR